jgi:large repetitive protein
MQVHRAASSWSQATVNWSNQPAATGTVVSLAVPGGAGPQVFTVTEHVRAMYAGPNYGFLVRDALSLTATRYQIYTSFEGGTVGNRPKLDVTWG